MDKITEADILRVALSNLVHSAPNYTVKMGPAEESIDPNGEHKLGFTQEDGIISISCEDCKAEVVN